MSLGDAALALGALWSGETQIRENSTPETLDRALTAVTRAATVRGARLAAALVTPIKRRVGALERRLEALELEVRGPEPRMPRQPIAAEADPEGVKEGETFRVIAHAGLPVGSVGEVVELYPLGCVGIIGPGWRLTTSAQVLLGPGWERVRAVEAPPVRAEVGDRFEALSECHAYGVGDTVTVVGIDTNDDRGDRWISGPSGRQALEDLAGLRDPKLYRPLPALAAATTEGETSDLDGPAGDERIGLTEAGATALGWAEDVKKLRDAWHAVPWDVVRAVDEEAAAFADVDRAIAALASRAGLLIPSKLPVTA